MSQDETPDVPIPDAAPKVAPENVALRAQPRPVTRLNQRTLALLTGGLGVAVLGKPSVTDMPFADSVPFGIRLVVSGPQPFIVLDNGNKLLVGGTYMRYRLIAVEPTRLVFDGPRPAIVLR